MKTKNKLEESERSRKALLSLLEDQKILLSKLTESEELFRKLAESTSTAIFIYKNEKFVFVNNATKILTGYSADELYNMNFWDVVHPDFKDIVKQRGIARQKGLMVPNRYEFKLIKKNGEESWIDFSASRIIWNGEPAAIGSAFDITERKKYEEELKESEQKFRLITENTADTIAVFDLNLNYVYISPSSFKLVGYTPDELKNLGLKEILTPESYEFVLNKLKEELELEKTKSADPNRSIILHTKEIKKDKSIIDVETIVSYIRDDNGNILNILTVSRDVTEKNKLTEKLIQSEEKLRLLVEGTSNFFFYTQDTNGFITYISPTVEKITGYKQDEWYNQTQWFATENPINDEATRLTHLHLKGELTSEPIYFELYHKNGNKILLEIFEDIIFKDGKVVGLQGIATDITEKKRAEIIQSIQYNIATAVVTTKNLTELFEIVRKELSKLINSKNFFIAFYDEKNDLLRSDIDKDEKDEIPVWSAKNSLTGYVIKNKKSILLSKEEILELSSKGEFELIGTMPESWLGVPLIINNNVIGVVAVQDYNTKNAYDKWSLELLEIIAKQLSIYIDKKNNEEKILKLSLAIEQSPVSVVITDTDGNIEYVNPQFCEVSGYSFNEVIGKNPRFLKSGKTNPQNYVELWQKIKNGESWKGEFINKKKTGEIYYENAFISPIKNENEEIINFVGIKEDITEKKKLIDLTIQSEEQFHSVWENSTDAMRLIDENGIIIDVNKAFCKLFEMKKEDLIGKSFDITYRDNKGDTIDIYKDRYKTNTIPKKVEAEAILHNNKKIWLDVSNSKVEIRNKPSMVLSIFRDITDKKKMINELIHAKEKAEEMNRIKSHFFATMSHELRTPFVGILGFAELLYDEIENEDHKDMINRIIHASKRLTNTLNQILDMTKLEFDKTEINIKNFDAISVIDDVYIQFEIAAKNKNLELKRNLKLDSCFINSDEKLISEILINLVNNAVKYTEKGWIEITADKKTIDNKEMFVVEIKDTGIGIAEDKKEIIWEDFRQASEGTSRRFEGTGLGLSIARRFAKLINANLYLKESQLGKGSTFVLEIPINFYSGESIPTTVINDVNQTSNEKITLSSTKKRKILYVEDDEMAIDIVTRTLTPNYNIESVKTSKQAFELINNPEKNYDLFLIDINLGADKMNGLELTNEIKKNDKYKNTPFVAITAFAREEDREEFLSNGMDYYISKPFSINDLRNLINSIFEEK